MSMFLYEVNDLIGRHVLHSHQRVTLHVLGNQRRDQSSGIRRRGDAQQPGQLALPGARPLDHLLGVVEECAALGEKRFTRLRDGEPARVYTGDMGNTFGSNGLATGSSRFVSWSS
jgi:hypothetical protein